MTVQSSCRSYVVSRRFLRSAARRSKNSLRGRRATKRSASGLRRVFPPASSSDHSLFETVSHSLISIERLKPVGPVALRRFVLKLPQRSNSSLRCTMLSSLSMVMWKSAPAVNHSVLGKRKVPHRVSARDSMTFLRDTVRNPFVVRRVLLRTPSHGGRRPSREVHEATVEVRQPFPYPQR